MLTRAIVLANRLALDGGTELSPAAVAVLRRTLTSLSQIGITEACVVDGDHAVEIGERLGARIGGMQITVLANRSWRRKSGAAVLLAREFLCGADGERRDPCLLVRGDRPLDREALAELAAVELRGRTKAAITIADPPGADLAIEAKVRLRNGRGDDEVGEVAELGLDLDRWDAVWTGHAVVSPELVRELERWSNPGLEDALAQWAEKGLVRARAGRLAWPWGLVRAAEVATEVEAILGSKRHPRYTLLNPGPVNTTAHVKAALVHHDVCHRDSNFSELMVSLTGKLRRVFRGTPDHTICVVTGSGTSAMECAIASAVPTDRKVLVIDNGAFGERLQEICSLHEMDVVHLRYAWGDEVDPADVERAFQQHPDIAVVAMTHHETSVGLLNPVAAIGKICRRYDALLLCDAVSSLGAEDLDVVRDNVDICWGSANKCLHAISGVGFLCVSPRVWPKIAHIKPRTYYLDLKRYRKYVDELAQTPFTPAVSNYFALDAACDEFLADGHQARWTMYKERNRRMRHGLAAMGMAPFTRTGRESHSVVTCTVPTGVPFAELYAGLKARGYIAYACKDVLAERFMQVANMGEMTIEGIDGFLAAVATVIAEVRGRAPSIDARAPAAASRATA
jgi:2-aminoethylphosphonate-pyruvate transaminase